FALEPVSSVLLELPHRIRDRVPVTGEEHPRLQRGQSLQGPQVSGDVPLRVGDHRAATTEDEVAGEHRAILWQPEAEVVGAVAGRVQRGDVQVADANDLVV